MFQDKNTFSFSFRAKIPLLKPVRCSKTEVSVALARVLSEYQYVSSWRIDQYRMDNTDFRIGKGVLIDGRK